jgi:mannose-1-phosphate guanylyltransferase
MQTMPAHQITQAVILAAGLGTRLRPLTDSCPKPMLPINGKPLLEHTILLLKDQGITNFVLNLHHFPEQITEYFGDGKRHGISVKYSDESNGLSETAGALKKMEPILHDNFLFMYGDELHSFNFKPLIDFHIQNKALATVVLKRSDLPQNGDIGEVESVTRRMVAWHVRPHAIMDYGDRLHVNGGLYALSQKIVNYIPAGRPVKLDGETLPAALAAGELVFGWVTNEEILDIGTIEKYRYAEEWHKKIGLA